MKPAEVAKVVKQSAIVVFGKSYCPYTMMAKQAITNVISADMTLQNIDVDLAPYSSSLEETKQSLSKITGRTTWPQVFVHGKFIGGGTEVSDMEQDGTLASMIGGRVSGGSVSRVTVNVQLATCEGIKSLVFQPINGNSLTLAQFISEYLPSGGDAKSLLPKLVDGRPFKPLMLQKSLNDLMNKQNSHALQLTQFYTP
jgi:glutaredoxin 3